MPFAQKHLTLGTMLYIRFLVHCWCVKNKFLKPKWPLLLVLSSNQKQNKCQMLLLETAVNVLSAHWQEARSACQFAHILGKSRLSFKYIFCLLPWLCHSVALILKSLNVSWHIVKWASEPFGDTGHSQHEYLLFSSHRACATNVNATKSPHCTSDRPEILCVMRRWEFA